MNKDVNRTELFLDTTLRAEFCEQDDHLFILLKKGRPYFLDGCVTIDSSVKTPYLRVN
jgi:hypothetical protein